MVVDHAVLYWLHYGEVYRANLDGSKRVLLAQGRWGTSLAVDAKYVYFTAGQTIMKVAK